MSTESSQESEKSDSSRGRKRKNNSGAPAAKRVKDGKYKIQDVIDKEVSCFAWMICISILMLNCLFWNLPLFCIIILLFFIIIIYYILFVTYNYHSFLIIHMYFFSYWLVIIFPFIFLLAAILFIFPFIFLAGLCLYISFYCCHTDCWILCLFDYYCCFFNRQWKQKLKQVCILRRMR